MSRVSLHSGASLLFLALAAACSAADPSFPTSGHAGSQGSGAGGATTSSGSGGTTSSGGQTGSGSSGASGSSSGGATSGSGSSGTTSSSGSGGASDAGTPAHDAGPSAPPPDAAQSLEDLCVATINGYRATIGQPPYTRWTAAESCTSGEAQKDSETGTAHSAFGACNEFGQCECPGWSGPIDQMIVGCLKAMWDEGPGGGHHDIMASSDYKKVACGFFTMTSGSIWAAQDYE